MENCVTAPAPAPQMGMPYDYAAVVDSWLNLEESSPSWFPLSPTLEVMDREVVELNGPRQGSSSKGTGRMWELVPGDGACVAAELARANGNTTSFNLCGTRAEDAHLRRTTPESYRAACGVSSVLPSSMVNIVRGCRPMPESSSSYTVDIPSTQGLYPPEHENGALNFSVPDQAGDMDGDPMIPLCTQIKDKELTGGCQNSGATGSAWIKLHMDLLGMAPEDEGKPAVGSGDGKTVVAVDELLDIEQLMVKLQVRMEGISYSGLMSSSFKGGLKSRQQDTRALMNRILANKKDNVTIINDITLLKLRNIIPQQQATEISEVAVDELLDIEQLMVNIKVQMDKICSSDVMSNLCVEGELELEQQIEILTTKQDTVKIINELALLKLRNIIPREKTSVEDVISKSRLKRSRPLSSLHVPPRVWSFTGPLNAWGPEASVSPLETQNSAFDIPNPTLENMTPIKFIRTGDDIEATLQKLSTILMPTAKLGDGGLPIVDVPDVPRAVTHISPAAVGGTRPTPPSFLSSNTHHDANDPEREAGSASKKPRGERKRPYEQAKELLPEEKELERRPHLDEIEEHGKRQFVEEQEKVHFRDEISQAWTKFASDLTNKISKKIQDLELASGRDKVAKLTEDAGEILGKAGPIKAGRTVGDARVNSTTVLTVTDGAQILSNIFKQLQSMVKDLIPKSGEEQLPVLKAVSQLIEEGCSVVIKLGFVREWISKRLQKLVTDLKFRERVVERHFQNCATSISALVPSFLEEQRSQFLSVTSVCS